VHRYLPVWVQTGGLAAQARSPIAETRFSRPRLCRGILVDDRVINENPGGAWIGYLDCLGPPGSDCLFAPGSPPGYLDYTFRKKEVKGVFYKTQNQFLGNTPWQVFRPNVLANAGIAFRLICRLPFSQE